MIVPYQIKTNKERIRYSIINKIKKISKFKRRHPENNNLFAKILYFKEPVGVGNFQYDRIGNDFPYHVDKTYNVCWEVVSNKELMEMYRKIKDGETYCFFVENEGSLGRQVWNMDLNRYEIV